MELVVTQGASDPNIRPFDIAERKGVGHPDTIADALAYSFSRNYSTWCEEYAGRILNHWVDKTTCVGARTVVDYGSVDIIEPIRVLLIGKLTRAFGDVIVPVEEILDSTVRDHFSSVLTPDAVNHFVAQVLNTAGVAVDHDPSFYEPSRDDGDDLVRAGIVANDTMFVVGHAWRSLLLDLADVVEGSLLGSHNAIGTDIKMMLTRAGSEVDIVAAVPVIPTRVANRSDYLEILDVAEHSTRAAVSERLEGHGLRLRRISLNTKDRHGGAYLAPFGSSLGKGDVGAVGRGNRNSGGIEPYSSWTAEAPAGKNPLSHGGRIYPELCTELARRISDHVGEYVDVGIHARNGDDLRSPALVVVRGARDFGLGDRTSARIIRSIVRETIDEHISPGRYLGSGERLGHAPA